MKLNNISFPYPVLRAECDDVLPQLPKDSITIKVSNSTTEYEFSVTLKYDNKDIDKLIQEGKAIYSFEIDCIQTVWRKSFRFTKPTFKINIPRRDIAGNIAFSAYVSVKEPIKGYHNKGFNSDYGTATFDMEPGDILAGFPVVQHHIDIKYDKLQAAGSFMIIHEDPTKDHVNFCFEHDKIEINLPSDMFKQYQNGIKSNFAELMHASLAFNALTCALYELPNAHDSLQWVQALTYRLQTEPQFDGDFDEEERRVSDVPAVANKLLKDPYKRLFVNLTEQISIDSENDNG